MRNLIAILFFTIPFFSTWGADSSFEKANKAYTDAIYTEAITLYQEILKNGANSDVLYNLANAYYKTGQLPEAILNYEKALKIAPNDKDIRHNLQIANAHIKDKITPIPEFFLLTWWKKIAQLQKSNLWAISFIIFLWLSVTLFLLFALTNLSIKNILFFSGIGSFALSIILLLFSITQHKFETNSNTGIIMAASVAVKSAPLNTGTDLFIIHSGLKIAIVRNENEWLNIRLSDGKEGWIKKEVLSNI